MASYRTRASGSVEACIRRKSLPGDIYLSFNSLDEAKAYCREAEALIDAGQTPAGLLDLAKPKTSRQETFALTARTLHSLISEYLSGYHVTEGDKQWLAVLREEVGQVEIGAVTVQWALGLVRGYKITKKLTPATIRHRVGALRRCLDWHVTFGNLPMNPLKLLPTRYATYNDTERAAVEDAPPSDNSRDRRLEPGEEERIRLVLSNDPDYLKALGVERGIDQASQAPMTLLFELALETAMRMRETFTLSLDQIDIEKRTIFLDKTKNGDSRQVPLSSVALSVIKDYLTTAPSGGLVFPLFWNGDTSAAGLRKASARLSGRWRTIARLAKCDDLHFHDLRHEATSRLFEKTKLSDLQIAKITGHRDPRMLMRYANLRASDLADQLW